MESLRFGRSSTIHRRSERARGEEIAAGPRGVVSLVLRSINTILLSARPVPCHTALRRAAPHCAVPCCAVPKSVRPSDRPWRVRVRPLRSVPRSHGPRAAAGPARRPCAEPCRNRRTAALNPFIHRRRAYRTFSFRFPTRFLGFDAGRRRWQIVIFIERFTRPTKFNSSYVSYGLTILVITIA